MHPSSASLRMYLDKELPEFEQAQLEVHLNTCSHCQHELAMLNHHAEETNKAFSRLATENDLSLDFASLAYQKFLIQKETTMSKSRFSRLRLLGFAATAIAVVVFAFSFAPVRAWAAQFLGLFRVEQITLLPVDISRLENVNGDSSLIDQLSTVMADSIKFTKEPGDLKTASSLAEASQLAGFNVRGVEGLQAAKIEVQDSAAFEFTLNRELAQSVIDAAGRTDLKLPESIDGAKISADIPASAFITIGDCPSAEKAREMPLGGARRSMNCTTVLQIPSPTITTPPDLDIQQLALIGLQMTGMTSEEASQFSRNIDWSSTLVIPIPSRGAKFEQINVDGVSGNLITDTQSPQPTYTILWVKDGVVYAVSGFGPAESGLAIANALK